MVPSAPPAGGEVLGGGWGRAYEIQPLPSAMWKSPRAMRAELCAMKLVSEVKANDLMWKPEM